MLELIKKVVYLLEGTLYLHQAELTLKVRSIISGKDLQGNILKKMARDRNPRLTLFADKWLVREYVRELVGDEILTKTFGSYQVFPEARPEGIPRNFAVKANHGSGGVVLVWEGAPRGSKITFNELQPWAKFLLHPDDLVWDDLKDYFGHLLEQTYYWSPGRLPEWGYKNIERRVFFEEFLAAGSKSPAEDFKFFTVGGECRLIQHDIERYSQHKRNLYDPGWNLVGSADAVENYSPAAIKPETLKWAIDVAAKLSAGTDFLRVDLYLWNDRIVFGELTNYPDAGKVAFRPKSLMKDVAQGWNPNYVD